jgi:hypothetical protein
MKLYVTTMRSLDAIVRSIDEEIDRLQRARSLLTGHTAPLKRGMPRPKQPIAARSEVGHKHLAGKKKDVAAEHLAMWTRLKEEASGS